MKLNLKLLDGTDLQSIMLSTTKDNYAIGEIKTTEEFYKWLDSDGNQRMYFSGQYVQGGISHPKIISSYEILEDRECKSTLICKCGKIYRYIPHECGSCGNVFVDC